MRSFFLFFAQHEHEPLPFHASQWRRSVWLRAPLLSGRVEDFRIRLESTFVVLPSSSVDQHSSITEQLLAFAFDAHEMPTTAIIGAGPVGCLTALGLQQRGYDVVIFERRTEETIAPSMGEMIGNHDQHASEGSRLGAADVDSRLLSRSINLAISVRGLTALEHVDSRLAQMVLGNAVPMRARMIHHKPAKEAQSRGEQEVKLDSQAYSTKGHCINSVPRLLLSRMLLNEVQARKIEVRWGHKLRGVRFSSEAGRPTSLDFDLGEGDKVRPEEVVVDAVFGCDGHYSRVRKAMQATKGLQVSETRIDNHYVELHIPPKREIPPLNGQQQTDATGSSASKTNGSPSYALDPNHLHIWPRHDFMLIALANRDGSFTSTLFAPQRVFDERLSDADSTIAFFTEQFPDALRVIGREALVQQVCGRTPSPLGVVTCQSYHVGGQALLLGDAGHAMVPFYGQGLNCGLEDVRIMLTLLDEQLKKAQTMQDADEKRDARLTALQLAFEAYSSSRHADLVAINQLAIHNYEEMSSHVVRRSYLTRKRIDAFLERHLPQGWWAGLYTNVTFSNMGYHAARVREARQSAFLHTFLSTAALGSIAAVALTARRAWLGWQSS